MKMNFKNNKGFTMVELGIVFVIIGILTLNSVMAYRKFVKDAMISEGKMLASSIAKIQKLYHAESGDYHAIAETSYNTVPEIDARFNKYFKTFSVEVPGTYQNSIFTVVTKSETNVLVGIEIVLHAFENKASILIVDNIADTSGTGSSSQTDSENTQTDNTNNGNNNNGNNGNNGNGNGNGNNGGTTDGDDNNKGGGQEKNGNNGNK